MLDHRRTRAQESERRVALVIGNAGYQHVDRLANPGNDAKLIADTLRKSGLHAGGWRRAARPRQGRVRPAGARVRPADPGRRGGAVLLRGSRHAGAGHQLAAAGRCQPDARAGLRLPAGQRRTGAEADGRRGDAAEHRAARRLPQQSVRQPGHARRGGRVWRRCGRRRGR